MSADYPSIAQQLAQLNSAIGYANRQKKYNVLFPTTLTWAATHGTEVKALFQFGGPVNVKKLGIKVRSLGAGTTYVAIGNSTSQELRLTGVGDYIGWPIPDDGYIDAREFFGVCDHADGAVIEIIGTLVREA